MKLLSLFLPTILLCLCFAAWQQFNNAIREEKAREIIQHASSNTAQNYEQQALKAISLLNYRNFLGHNVIVDAPLIASIYVSMNQYVEDNNQRAKYLHTAINYYLAATKLKPAYGNYWALIAQAKIYLGQNDEEFARYLTLAHKYGPHNYMVHVNMAIIGQAMLNNSMVITDLQRDLLVHHLSYGLVHRKSSSSLQLLLLKQDAAQAEMCKWMADNKVARKKLHCA
ncbi:hypothetical protein SAMN05216361_0536 [Marisediminitalea aggregata]|uniref:Tetratricopeptide repeat-containing protein n=1 Tax=Marisediminitalea aggregata TaxID=634436 RepID=A0A1M5ETJ9_9ALTE|nr:hypothetical protein [Marisediminitalea aggregata]SHF82578.1 hypothetical protein SAMN05216361_0536 [Marisediminitalea aggregata]